MTKKLFSLLKKITIIICLINILIFYFTDVKAKERKERGYNSFSAQIIPILTEEEIDDVISQEMAKTNNIVNYNNELNSKNALDSPTLNVLPAGSFIPNSNEHIKIETSVESNLISIFVGGQLDSQIDGYSFEYLVILLNDNEIERIDSLSEDNKYLSDSISIYQYDTTMQYQVISYYSKIETNENGEPQIDPTTLLPIKDYRSYAYFSDSFVITKIDDNYLTTQVSKMYGVSLQSLIDDNKINTSLIKKGSTIFLRNPQEKCEFTFITTSNYNKLSNIGYIDSNIYLNEVNIATGNYCYANNDLFIDEYDGLYLNRYYNSQSEVNDNHFGNFASSLDIKLLPLENDFILILEDGRAIVLSKNNNKYYSVDEKYCLEEDADSYIVSSNFDDKKRYIFDNYYQLTSVLNKHGLIYKLIYENYKLTKLVTRANKEIIINTNDRGLITSIILPNGANFRYQYSNDNKLIKVIDELGYELEYVYKNDLLTQVLNDESKPITTITYDGDKVISIRRGDDNNSSYSYQIGQTIYIDPNGNNFIYENNSYNEIIKIVYPDSSSESFHYDLNGNIISYLNRVNQLYKYCYDGNNNLIKTINPDNSAFLYMYDNNNNLLYSENVNKTKTIYEYNENNYLSKTIYDDQSYVEYYYDEKGRVIIEINEEGDQITYLYQNDFDKPIEIIDANRNVTSYTYDVLGNILSTTKDGETTSFEYDLKSNLVKTIGATGEALVNKYNQSSLITEIVDENNNLTIYKYDVNNRLIEKVIGQDKTVFIYDGNNNLIFESDPLGNHYQYEYDFNNNLIRTIGPDNIVYGNTYDKKGNITSTTDRNGNTEYFFYDDTLNKIVKYIDKIGRVYTYTYDEVGNKLSEILPDLTILEYEYDSKNRMISSTNELGIKVLYSYDKKGNLLRKTNSLGNYEEYEYDSNNNLISQKDALGNETTFVYDNDNRLIKKIEPNNSITIYKYDAVGNLISQNINGNIIKYTYSGNNLISIKDANGNITTYSYDSSNRPIKEKYQDGSINAVVYDGNGNVISRIDSYGNITRYEYNKDNYNTKVIDPLGNETIYEYDYEGNNTKIIYPNGKNVKYTYNALSWLTKIEESTGLITDINYDIMGRIVSIISNNGVQEYSTYDKYGNLIEKSDQQGNSLTYTYDDRGLLISSMSYTLESYQYEYDILERLISVKDNKGVLTYYTYDANSNIIKIVDSLGHCQENIYDLNGNIIKTIDSLGIEKYYEYDNNNNLIKLTYDDGSYETYSYDYLNRQISYTDPNGNTSRKIYDLNGNMIEEANNLSVKIKYQYNGNNQLIGFSSGDYNVTYQYDNMGNNTEIVDPYGAITTYEYDLDSRCISTTNAYGAKTRYKYDKCGNLINTIYDNGLQTTNTYDNSNRLISTTDIYGLTTYYQYDEYNNISLVHNDLGQEEKLSYDDYNRLVKDEKKGVYAAEYYYDLCDNIIRKVENGISTSYSYDLNNQLVKESYSNGRIITYQYDHKGNIIQKADGVINNPRIYAYEYDNAGNLISYTNPLNDCIEYTYDKNNRLATQSDYYGNKIVYSYDDLHNNLSIEDYNGNITSYQYDFYGNITKQIDALGNVTEYKYDLMSKLVEITDPDLTVSSYQYDKMGNLVNHFYNSSISAIISNNQHGISYTYDVYGNLLYINDPEKSEIYDYDDYGRLIKITYPSGKEKSYEYDINSNLLKTTYKENNKETSNINIYDEYSRLISSQNINSKITYKYDDFNRVIEVNNSSMVVKYEYDIYSNITKLVYPDNSEVEYYYDDYDNVISINDNLGETLFSYDKNANLLTQKTPNNISIYSYDNNGNRITAVNKDLKGNFVSIYNYEYNGVNKIIQEEIIDGNNITTKKYEYNSAGNICQQETKTNGKIDISSFEFDIYGNKIKETIGDIAYIYNYDENQLINKTCDNNVIESYKYDTDGNLVSKETEKGKYVYTYTEDNKLENVYLNGKLESRYYYDARGLKSYELLKKTYPNNKDDVNELWQEVFENSKEMKENANTFIKEVKYVDDNAQFDDLLKIYHQANEQVSNSTISFISALKKVLKGTSNNEYSISFEEYISNEYYQPEYGEDNVSKWDNVDVIIYEPNYYIYDYSHSVPNVLTIASSKNKTKSDYTYVGSRLIHDNKNNESYLYDGKYSISEIISPNRKLSLRYDIYGNILTNLSKEDKVFSYNSLEYTPQNELIYANARFYDASTGTFITKDSYLGNIYYPDTTNRYAYCSGDPINKIDINGHKAVNLSELGGGIYSSNDSNTTDYNYGKYRRTISKKEKYITQTILDKLKTTPSSLSNRIKSIIDSSKSIKGQALVYSSNNYISSVSLLNQATSRNSDAAKHFVSNMLGKISFDAFDSPKEDVDITANSFADYFETGVDLLKKIKVITKVTPMIDILSKIYKNIAIGNRYANNQNNEEKIKKSDMGEKIYMNGQGRIDEYGNFDIGALGNLSDNGCGILATYNALITLGDYENPSEIIKYMDENDAFIIGGKMGTNPLKIDNYFKDKGYDTYNIILPRIDDLDCLVKENNTVILSYAWFDNGIGAHFIELHYNDISDEYEITNQFNDSTGPYSDESLTNYLNTNFHYDSMLCLVATVINKKGEE